MSLGDNSAADSAADGVDLPGLLRLAKGNLLLIAGFALAFALAAMAWTIFRGAVYEATAFVEVDDPKEVSTFAQKLRFPSVYRLGGENDAIEAQGLARRTRVKVVRDSRIIAVTVRGSDPEGVAVAADKVVAAFLPDTHKGESALVDDTIDGLSGTAPSPPPYPIRADVWLTEAASVPNSKAGPAAALVWIVAAMAGAFSGFLFALLRSS